MASFSQFKHSVLEGEEAQGTQEIKKVTYLGAQKLGRQGRFLSDFSLAVQNVCQILPTLHSATTERGDSQAGSHLQAVQKAWVQLP